MGSEQDLIIYTVVEGIAEIRFNRPERLNALDLGMAIAFAQAVEQALGDPSVRVIVISGQGRAFMAGGDLSYFHAAPDRSAAAYTLVGTMHEALKRLAAAPHPVIGSLKGAVAGGGMSLAMGLDLLVVAEDTSFNMAYARIGTSPDCGGSWTLPKLVGPRRALEIALLSDTIDADYALALGLINRIVPLDALETTTMDLARRLAAGAPLAQGRIKALIRTSYERSYDEQLDAERLAFAASAATEDFGGAITAFLEKRKISFSGR